MAAAALERMRGAAQANLLPGPGIQTPGGLAWTLVLVLLLASAVSTGKRGATAGRVRERGEGLGAGLETDWARGKGASECPEQTVSSWGIWCLKRSKTVGSYRV